MALCVPSSIKSMLTGPVGSLLLKRGRCDGQDDDQTGDDEAAGNEGDEDDGPARSRELASNDVVLGFEVAMEAEQ